MPANLVHCQCCRALLNDELKSDSVVIPEFIPLPEISTMMEATLTGYYVDCPACHRELRIHRKYVGEDVRCKHCAGPFPFDLANSKIRVSAFYSKCPHCAEELRANTKYLGARVACKSCDGKIHLKAAEKIADQSG